MMPDMRRTATATVALLLAAVLPLAGCGSSHHAVKSTPSACRAAIRAQYVPGTATLKGTPTEPPACQGLSDARVSSITQSVIEANTR
jgi:hypothetical protein